MRLLIAPFIVVVLAACGGSGPPPQPPVAAAQPPAPTAAPPPTAPPPAAPTADTPAAKPPEPKKKTAKEVLTADGAVFMFSLADSPDAKHHVDEDCAQKAKKDDKKLDACKKDAELHASEEGIRFEKDAKGEWWWISFGKEKDKEAVFNKVKFKIATESGDKLTVTPEGHDEGKRPMKTLPKELVFETPTETTVAMTDPKKGKLLFKKK